ncbi:14588_t:CDS:2, partial [Entrophospora sp. SA101]
PNEWGSNFYFIEAEANDVNNRTIIEFKEPDYFSSPANIDKTRKKVEEEYISKQEEAERINAILYDGYKLGFYENKQFIGMFSLNENTIRKLIYLTLNDEKKVFSSENLINDFQKTKSLDKFAHRNRSEDYLKKVRSLSSFFNVKIDENENEKINKSLFALQTSFAFVLKIISLKGLEKKFSFKDPINLKNISLSPPNELKSFLDNLEYGRIHQENYNIINFFEGDFFLWYVEIFEDCEKETRESI